MGTSMAKDLEVRMMPDIAIVLAGGLGTRLGEMTKNIPKPMVEVDGKPVIAYVLDELIGQGINTIVLSLGYKADVIIDYVEKNYSGKAEIEYVVEKDLLGTGGALRKAVENIKVDYNNAIVMFGDDINYMDFSKMYKFHLEKRAPITIAVREVEDVSSSGAVEVENDIITSFIEKPLPGSVKTNLINGGIHIFTKDAMNLLLEREEFSLTKDFFESIVDLGILYAYKSQHSWHPIDTPERYKKAQDNIRMD